MAIDLSGCIELIDNLWMNDNAIRSWKSYHKDTLEKGDAIKAYWESQKIAHVAGLDIRISKESFWSIVREEHQRWVFVADVRECTVIESVSLIKIK